MVLPVSPHELPHLARRTPRGPGRSASSPPAASRRSTTFCVAMPAWSVPGCQSASRPCIRRQRMSTSWMVLFSPCPMCSTRGDVRRGDDDGVRLARARTAVRVEEALLPPPAVERALGAGGVVLRGESLGHGLLRATNGARGPVRARPVAANPGIYRAAGAGQAIPGARDASPRLTGGRPRAPEPSSSSDRIRSGIAISCGVRVRSRKVWRTSQGQPARAQGDVGADGHVHVRVPQRAADGHAHGGVERDHGVHRDRGSARPPGCPG